VRVPWIRAGGQRDVTANPRLRQLSVSLGAQLARRNTPPSYATITCAVSHPPSGSGWRVQVTQQSPFSKRDPLSKSWEKVTSPKEL
jgi:hypothetical protein